MWVNIFDQPGAAFVLLLGLIAAYILPRIITYSYMEWKHPESGWRDALRFNVKVALALIVLAFAITLLFAFFLRGQ
jgi:hypothetical protein